ncbi:MAG: toll/interleukin-1 receptor domain-containing protein [Candidatus Nanopelagicales bacterium]
MKPGENIRLIEGCVDLLLAKPYANMMLTLRQFGFPTREQTSWEDPDKYVIEMLSSGPEDQLVELLTFLRGEDAEPTHRDDDQPWGDMPVHAFLSHIHQERHLVGEVKKILASNYHIDAFVAHDDIHVSKRWREVIKAGLATCDMFVAFLHDGYHASQWCDQEAGWALARNIPVISVRPLGVERRDGFLEEHQDFGLNASYGNAAWPIARQIFVTAVSDSRTREAGTTALVETFVGSWSYDTTRFLWAILNQVTKFESAHLRRLEYAVQTNRQVYDATVDGVTVPELVKALVERFEPAPLDVDPWAQPPTSDEPPPF